MRAARSYFGAFLAVAYAAAFALAYWLYAQHAGQFMADIWLSIAALPYILTARTLTGSSDFSADSIGELLAATAFCCTLTYVVGAAVEALLRGAVGLIRRRRDA